MTKLKELLLCYKGRISPYGFNVIRIAVILSFLVFFFSRRLGFFLFAVSGFIVYFFRDPERIPSDFGAIVISPADGLVVGVSEEYLPGYLGLKKKEKYTKVSIFLSIFDVHVNRVPVSGTVIKKQYRPGNFLNVLNERSSIENEQNAIVIEGAEKSGTFVCVQIAGLIARRIMCEAQKGSILKAGDRYGIIYFGSRVEIYIPSKYNVVVKKEQRMIGGETIIALA